MEQITVRLPTELIEDLDRIAEESGRSRAEVIRDELDSVGDSSEVERVRERYDGRVQELEQEIDWLRARLEAKENEFETLVSQREENTELKEYVSEQQRRQELGWIRSKWNDLTGWE